jgi:hypothetical protein
MPRFFGRGVKIFVKQDPTNSGAAEESFLSAIAIAQHQKARSM